VIFIIAHPCHRRDLRGELLRSRIARVQLAPSTIRNPAFDSPTLRVSFLLSLFLLSRTTPLVFVLIIIHRATTVAQRLLLADYAGAIAKSLDRFARSNVVFGCIVSFARARKHARTRERKLTLFFLPMRLIKRFEEQTQNVVNTLIS